jgi:hypothetical protein
MGVLSGCSSSTSGSAPADQPPVIDSVNAAPTAKAGTQWTITATFHDPDKGDVIGTIHLQFPDLMQDLKQAPSGNTAAAAGVEIIIPFPANTPKGAHPYELSLIDAKGGESAIYMGTVTIQ